MSYKTTMAVLDADTPPGTVVAHAAAIAKLFDGRVMGIVGGLPDFPMYFAEGPQAPELYRSIRTDFESRIKKVRSEADQKLADQGVPNVWREPEMETLSFFCKLCRGADLVIVERDDEHRRIAGLTPSNLILEAGRPVILVSPETHSSYFSRVVVAWKDSKECRRAVSDALPLLKRAAQVTILTVDENNSDDKQSPAWDVVEWLGTHNVVAVPKTVPSGGNIGEAIAQYAHDNATDLIVAGAYGHSRFAEWVLGGVTDHLVRLTRYPVLFAH